MPSLVSVLSAEFCVELGSCAALLYCCRGEAAAAVGFDGPSWPNNNGVSANEYVEQGCALNKL